MTLTTTDDLNVQAAPQAGMDAPLPWLKPLVAVVVVILALLSLLELAVAFIWQTMPAMHFVAGPIAIGLMVIIWFVELGGLHWPRLVFVALVTAPNLWLAIIGHTGLNFFFLTLTVVWATYRGSRAEGLAALALNLAVIGVSAVIGIANGYVALGPWIPWASGPVLAWWATRVLVA